MAWFERVKTENTESRRERQEKWDRLRVQVDGIVDGLGRPIDENIKSLVISLKANGFGTSGSCEGHTEQEWAYPWVDVESLTAEQYYSPSRFKELKKRTKTRTERQEFFAMMNLIEKANVKTQKQLQNVLEEYYASKEGKQSERDLRIQVWGWNASRLQPKGIPDSETQAKSHNPLSESERAAALKEYRRAVDDFTAFLTAKYFYAKN